MRGSDRDEELLAGPDGQGVAFDLGKCSRVVDEDLKSTEPDILNIFGLTSCVVHNPQHFEIGLKQINLLSHVQTIDWS